MSGFVIKSWFDGRKDEKEKPIPLVEVVKEKI